MSPRLRVQSGGHGEPVLLLIHGLGATGDVWRGWASLLEQRWPGGWLAPDLPGHGGSPAMPDYTFEAFADAVAAILPPDAPTVVIGHSLGGVVGLVLAGTRGDVETVIGLGIKVAWTGEELQRAQMLAERPAPSFDTRDEAAARYLRVSGLAGLLAADDPAVEPGLRADGDRWGLAMDPRTFGVGAPAMPALLARARAAVTLARGEHDQMCTQEQLRALGAPTVTLPGLGHNAHVENPEATLTTLVDSR
jgi:pimeloyl-ACP methyl ester carboxylesterase